MCLSPQVVIPVNSNLMGIFFRSQMKQAYKSYRVIENVKYRKCRVMRRLGVGL